jgi:hypothetical protein
MRLFHLERNIDVTGISGTGAVAEGVEFSNGICALHWLTSVSSIAIYRNIEELEAIHGHQGSTKIIIDRDLGQPSPSLEEGHRFADDTYVVCRIRPYVKVSILFEDSGFAQYTSDNSLEVVDVEEHRIQA